ncbi:hypothetical protein F0562_021534 [Nyssa sinensis]|uniref:Uncharacterized protein n=1 Tax=Nyssa sinensis TaxID=561372 RepID=A0A5J5BML5_9ASTE|nr:hypothetical protein F0562_021534 [Nyssa sinensis]
MNGRTKKQFGSKKSRLQWLKEGDRNAAFFHATTVQHRQRNKTFGLEDSSGYGRAWSTLERHDAYIQLASFILWNLWKARNAQVFSHLQEDPMQVVNRARVAATEFAASLLLPAGNVSSSLNSPAHWYPHETLLKLNVNCARLLSTGTGGVGGVVQDPTAEFFGSF